MLEQKIKESKRIITEAINMYGNKLCLSYSGGKDSKVLWKLTKELTDEILVIHNEHITETIEEKFGILKVNGTKLNVPSFLKTVDLKAQLDGTRKDEDKFVMIDGIDIHRSKMTSYKTENGVWGLVVYFPLINWTDKDIYEYLNQ